MFRLGIIGSGFGLYGLLPAFNSLKDCRVVCICGKKSERLVNYCSSVGLNNIYTSWEEMLDKEELDAIAVAVTPDAQYKIVKKAISKGLHIFAEKPLAENLKHAAELYNLANKKKVTNAVDFIFPDIPEWQKVKELLDKKLTANLNTCLWSGIFSYDIKNKVKSWKTDAKKGGGALAFYFSHCLFALENFAGPAVVTNSHLEFSKESLNGAETGVDVNLKFKNGALGFAHVSCNALGKNNQQLIFVCQKATIILENLKDSTVKFSLKIVKGKTVKLLKVKQYPKIKNQDERVSLVKNLAKRFITSAQKNKPTYPSFKEGLRVSELIEKIRLASAKF